MVTAFDSTPPRSGQTSGRYRPRDLIERAADFISGQGATARLGGSNYGTMCEVAANLACSSVRCGRCDGFGFLGVDRETLEMRGRQMADEHNADKREALRIKWNKDSTCPSCRGTGCLNGTMVPSLMDTTFTTVACPGCSATGKLQLTRRGHHVKRLAALIGVDLDTCARCHGAGYLIPVTVKETGSSAHGKHPPGSVDVNDDTSIAPVRVDSLDPGSVGDWADDEALIELAQMSRLIGRLRESDPTSAVVLDLYYGIDGDRYGAHKWGRLFAVWPLTHAGKQIVAETGRASSVRLRPIERLANERNRSELLTVPDLRLRSLLGRADREARGLLDRAHRALREAAR